MFNPCIWRTHQQKGKLMRSDFTFELAWGEVSPEQNRDLHLVKVKVAWGEVSPEQKRTGIDILWKWKLHSWQLFWLARGPAEFWCEATGFLGQAGFKRWRGDRVVGSSLTQSKVHIALLGWCEGPPWIRHCCYNKITSESALKESGDGRVETL